MLDSFTIGTVWTRPCANCGTEFTTTGTKRTSFCSDRCKSAAAKRRLGLVAVKTRKRAAGVKARRLENIRRDNPLPDALDSEDSESILRALRSICMINHLGCWIPRETYDEDGSRQVYIEGGYPFLQYRKPIRLHRVALEARLDRRLGPSQAHHACAVRACCNPEHLQEASWLENQLEMMERHDYQNRIRELERALMQIDPQHPLLD